MIEKYFQHMPECDCLANTTCKVPCSCGRDENLAAVNQIMTDHKILLMALSKINLTIFHWGPLA
jgi:hypothetical protein